MNKHTKKQASALALAYSIIIVLVVVATAHYRRVNLETDDSARFVARERAFWYAESGINHALAQANAEDFSGWSGTNTTKTYKSSLESGYYSVTADGVGTNTIKTRAIGYALAKGTGIQQRTIETTFRPAGPFDFGAFGKYSLHLDSNALTDSYDSNEGAYNVDTAYANGDIGTNGVLLGIDSNAQINGNASTGPGGEVDISGNAVVNGHISNENDYDIPPTEIPESVESLASSGAYTGVSGANHIPANSIIKFDSLNMVSNSTITIGANSIIYITGDLAQASNTSIITEGPVEIYVDGDVDIRSNGIVNLTTVTTDLKIYGSGPNAKEDQVFNINSNSDFYGVIYAPEALVDLDSNADIFGAVVGGIIDIDANMRLHYDEALQDLLYTPGTFKIKYWNEV